MYIKSFHIEGFGPLKNVSVEDIPCAMTVFLGNNEAGKSSAMEFVRAMLMGVPAKRNYLTQSIRNSKGGHMKIHDITHGDLEIIRHFSQGLGNLQVLNSFAQPLNKDVLGKIFAGMSRDVYRMIYGFNLIELQNISNFHGSEVFNTILGASFGLGLKGPVAALETIQERMDELYKSRSKNTQLQKLFDAWNKNKDEIDQAVEEIKQYDLFKEKYSSLEQKLISLRAEKTDIVRHGNEVQRFIGMWGQWNKWAQLQTLISQLPTASVSFPESAELVLERILEQEKIKHKNLKELEQKKEECLNRQGAFDVNELLINQKETVQHLLSQKDAYKQALSDNVSLCVKEEQFFHVLENVQKRLVEKWLQLDPLNTKVATYDYDKLSKLLIKMYTNHVQEGEPVLIDSESFQESNTIIDLLQEFSVYEARILDAQAHAQSAHTAIEYAKRDLEAHNAKKSLLEKEIQELMENERKEQAENIAQLNEFSPLSMQIDLTKEALRVIPEKLQRTLATLDSWKRQVDTLGIRNLDISLDTEALVQERLALLREEGKLFQLLNNGSEKDLFLHTSDIIKNITALRTQITDSAKKITSEEGTIKDILQQIERVDIQIADIPDSIESTKSNGIIFDVQSGQEKESIENLNIEKQDKEKCAQSLKESLELKSRALQKLQTINELRSQGMRDFNGINQETQEAQKNLAEKKTSIIALLPGIFCLLLGFPLLILRLLSGDNFIVFDTIQNIISFATLFPAWTGTLYVPLWLPCILVGIALVSLYLPLSRKSDLELDQNRFEVLQKKLAATLENLDALRKEEMSILSCTFDIKEVKQGKLFEAVRSSYEEEDELARLYEKENLSYANLSLQATSPQNKADEEKYLHVDESLCLDLKGVGVNNLENKTGIDADQIESLEINTQQISKDTIKNKNLHTQSLAKASEKMTALFTKVQKKVSGLIKEHDTQQNSHVSTRTPELNNSLEMLSFEGNVTTQEMQNSGDWKNSTEDCGAKALSNQLDTSVTAVSIAPISVEILEEQKAYNHAHALKILEENLVYREVAKFVHEELQLLWEKDYADLIAQEQRNDIQAQNYAKRLALLEDKRILEENLDLSKTLLGSFLEQWNMFFTHHYFTNIPEAQFIEAFFFRIAAAEALQRRLQELNGEVHDYNEHIRALRNTVEKDFPEIYGDLQNILQNQAIHTEQDTMHIQEGSTASIIQSVTTQDMLMALEKYIQNKRVALLSNKDISVREASFDSVLEAQMQSQEHLKSVQQNLIDRQALMDEEFMECVNFLYIKGLLSSEFVKESQGVSSASQLAHDFGLIKNEEKHIVLGEIPEMSEIIGESINDKDNSEFGVATSLLSQNASVHVYNIASASSKKPFLSAVKQVLETINRFIESMKEYDSIHYNKNVKQDFIESFESALISIIGEGAFTPVYSANVDYLEAFEQLLVRMEQENTKQKEVERLEENIAQIQDSIEAVKADLHEIRSNLDALLELAQVKDESALRVLIEAQKQREQLIRSSLDLEEAFRTVKLPKYVKKSQNPLNRAFKMSKENFETDLLNARQYINAEDVLLQMPEILSYFDEDAQGVWQTQLEDITEAYERIEEQEQEIQSTCGALQAKCDALIESASLISLKRTQLSIEEEIKDTYERWLELSLSKEIILKAQTQYEQEKQPQVIEMASDFFATITDNAWQKIIVSLDNKEIKVMQDNGKLVSPELLSQGAKEQLYLSLRLAHIKSRAQTSQTVPILMDDILVNFDAKRAENTIKTLNKLMTQKVDMCASATNGVSPETQKLETQKQAGQQILFYTCHEHTARILSDTIQDTKMYLVEDKMVRPA